MNTSRACDTTNSRHPHAVKQSARRLFIMATAATSTHSSAFTPSYEHHISFPKCTIQIYLQEITCMQGKIYILILIMPTRKYSTKNHYSYQELCSLICR